MPLVHLGYQCRKIIKQVKILTWYFNGDSIFYTNYKLCVLVMKKSNQLNKMCRFATNFKFTWLIVQLITKDASLCSTNNRHGIHYVCTITPLWQLEHRNRSWLPHVPKFECFIPTSSDYACVVWCLHKINCFYWLVVLSRNRQWNQIACYLMWGTL